MVVIIKNIRSAHAVWSSVGSVLGTLAFLWQGYVRFWQLPVITTIRIIDSKLNKFEVYVVNSSGLPVILKKKLELTGYQPDFSKSCFVSKRIYCRMEGDETVQLAPYSSKKLIYQLDELEVIYYYFVLVKIGVYGKLRSVRSKSLILPRHNQDVWWKRFWLFLKLCLLQGLIVSDYKCIAGLRQQYFTKLLEELSKKQERNV